ncbi:Protein-L-isoaspartate O-methyltransferase [bacterium HR35]|nr:Protein-L-isoaspartate O-methyltransferase [bacterium HR35]
MFELTPHFETYNELLDYLEKVGVLKTKIIKEAFKKFDRKDFLPEEVKEFAYYDSPIPVGEEVGQTSSQPYVTAFLIELLQPKEGNKILEVGFGSGWTTAILAELVGEKGKIFAFEIDEKIFNLGKQNLERYNFLEKGRVILILGDGSKGLKEESPFDRILVSAFSPEIPNEFLEQLKDGGILVIPDFEGIWQVIKEKGDLIKNYHPGYVFGPLRTTSK